MRARIAVRLPDLVGGARALTEHHRVIAVSLRHFFPEHWDGVGDTYSIAQHVDDMIAFIERLDAGAGGPDGAFPWRAYLVPCRAAAARFIAQADPGRTRRRTRCHARSAAKPGPSPLAARIAAAAEKIAAGDIDGGLAFFIDAMEGPDAWARLPATPKQLLRDNAMTLIGQVHDKRPPYSKADAEAIVTPTLFIGGGNTKGMLPHVLHTLAAHVKGSKTAMIPNTTHPMFEQAPQKFCEIVLEFLAG